MSLVFFPGTDKPQVFPSIHPGLGAVLACHAGRGQWVSCWEGLAVFCWRVMDWVGNFKASSLLFPLPPTPLNHSLHYRDLTNDWSQVWCLLATWSLILLPYLSGLWGVCIVSDPSPATSSCSLCPELGVAAQTVLQAELAAGFEADIRGCTCTKPFLPAPAEVVLGLLQVPDWFPSAHVK